MKFKLKNTQAVVLASLPAVSYHFSWLPFWFTILILALWSYVYFYYDPITVEKYKNIAPLLGVAAFFGVIAGFNFKYSMDVSVAALAVLMAIKPLEIKTARDYQVALFIAIFFTFISVFYFSTLFSTIYIFLCLLFILLILNLLENGNGTFKKSANLILKMATFAVPLTVLLFFIFPRVQVSLWSLSSGDRGRSGFSDNFRIDDIRNLAMNDDPAFRVEFNGEIPSKSDLYWRGIVFNSFDGTYWRRGSEMPGRSTPIRGGQEVRYRVVLEPHDSRWLFSLDIPESWEGNGRITADHTFRSIQEIHDTYSYEVISRINAEVYRDKSFAKETLYLPDSFNPQARALAASWKDTGTTQMILAQALNYFKENKFKYSLETSALGRNSIDDFLFSDRRGYCEHYASALAFLMRAAGVPSRVIGGYLGGDINEVGGYLIVRQSEAHVWVEIWDGNKWIRVDPTAYVAPARLTDGVRGVISEEDLPYLKNERRWGELYKLWNNLYLRLDAVNFAWSLWMESYSVKSQMEILKNFGFDPKDKRISLILIGGTLALLFFTVVIVLWRISKSSQVKIDDISRSYLKLLSKLRVQKPDYMGPLEFSSMLAAQGSLAELLKTYEQLRYSRLSSEERRQKEREFIRAVKEYRP